MSFFSEFSEEDPAAEGDNVVEKEDIQNYNFNPPYYTEQNEDAANVSHSSFPPRDESEEGLDLFSLRSLTEEFDLQAAASVLCFLVFVALLCGWFDRWVTRHRETPRLSTYSNQFRHAQRQISSLWRPEELNALYALERSAAGAGHVHQQHEGQALDLREDSSQTVDVGLPEVRKKPAGPKEGDRERGSGTVSETGNSYGHSSL